ncbi:MAG: beta-N-acetylhexosaminidase [Kiritimatiellia bacterium]
MTPPSMLPPPRVWEFLPGTGSASVPDSLKKFSQLSRTDPALHREGYRIEVLPEEIRLEIGSEAALPYAWQHFEQWPKQSSADQSVLRCGRLEDAPSMDHRGFMLDISRCKVPTRESLTEWVHLLAALRYNELQLYTEHTFAYRNHAEVWRDASPMGTEDILWLQDLCRSRGIELVPNQNCFGHFERWIRHPSYRKFAESPDGFVTPWGEKRKVGSVLKPDWDSLELVTGLLDELLPLFESGQVNIGCDETFELGQGFSKARCEQEGRGKVYTDFVRSIMEHVQNKHGKVCQFWGDILIKTPEYLRELPTEAVALEWGYEADHPFAEESRKFAESGLEFMICPGTSSWRTFAGRSDNMQVNLRKAAEAARVHGAQGLLLTDWGDCGHLQQNPVSYPALALCALEAWCGDTATLEAAWRWADQLAFAGSEGDSFCWLEAGRVQNLIREKRANCSRIFQLFENPVSVAAELSVEEMQNCLEAVQGLKAPGSFREEWAQTLRNMTLSLRTGLKLRGGKQEGLRDLLEETLRQQEALWRKKNREGGLAESLSMYTRVASVINEGEAL